MEWGTSKARRIAQDKQLVPVVPPGTRISFTLHDIVTPPTMGLPGTLEMETQTAEGATLDVAENVKLPRIVRPADAEIPCEC